MKAGTMFAKNYSCIASLCFLLFTVVALIPAEAQQIGATTGLRITKISGNSVTLTWNAATNADHYVIIYRYQLIGSYYRDTDTKATTTNVSIEGPGLTSWVVGAANANETQSGPSSNPVSAGPAQVPSPPLNNADPEDGPCPGCGASQNGPSAGEPVNLATGVESYEPSPDITVYNPSGLPVSFTRNFRSDRARMGQSSPGLSAGWGHSYDVSVQGPDTAGTWGALTLNYQNGAQETLTPVLDSSGSPTGAFVVPPGSSYYVTGTPSSTTGQWQALTLTWKDQTQWKLTPSAGGYVLSQIANRMGKSLSLNWNGSRQLTGIADATFGTTLLTLVYDSNGNLNTLTDVYGRKIVYTFGTPSGLTSQSLLSVSQIASTANANPLPRWTYNYIPFAGEPLLSTITVPSPTGTGTAVCQINYDTTSAYTTGAVKSAVDGNGNQRVYTYNASSTLVQIEDKYSGAVQSWTQNFDSAQHDTGTTDSVGKSTHIVYGDSTNPNLPTSITDRNNHQRQFTYDTFGNILTITSPLVR